MSRNWKLFINKTFQLKKNWQLFVLNKSFPIALHCECMVSEEVLKWKNDMWLLDKIKTFVLASYKWKYKFLAVKKPLLD